MLNIIVAIDSNNGIGKDNELLDNIKKDMDYFKVTTMNNTIVMGYNTYLSLPKKPLPSRRNIVITSKDIELEGCEVIHNIEELFNIITKEEEVFICGGASIYNQFIDLVDKLYITRIFWEYEADTFFPEIKIEDWKLESSQIVYGLPDLQFQIYKRKKNG